MNVDYFKKYIKDVRGVSERTAKHYISALYSINEILTEFHFPYNNLLSISHTKELEEIQAFLANNEAFHARDSLGHRMYSVAFKHYCRFFIWYTQH